MKYIPFLLFLSGCSGWQLNQVEHGLQVSASTGQGITVNEGGLSLSRNGGYSFGTDVRFYYGRK